ncbi:MAG: UvrD/REP [Planctomycetota bacterium]|nr:MAG: UvrD/REP [Planctomycetota bacterium]
MIELRIADTFTDSLARLTGDEQKAVKTTAFDMQLNPASPGMSFHKLDRAKDKNFWSVRVSSDVRMIVHRSAESLLLCYVDHHDKAYQWAERRKLEIHPKTGAAQLVELRETFKEVVVPVYVQKELLPAPKPLLFAKYDDAQLLGYGVPQEWLNDVRQANEDTLLALADHLPSEAAEALLELATGGQPQVAKPAAVGSDPFEHPDAQRRFRVMTNIEELQRALEYPWEKWTVFLHPTQRQVAEASYSGPARVAGSAGTGKTIVALHRAVFLARSNPNARVLLATFSDTLASSLRTRLRRLIGNEPRLAERLEIHSLNAIGNRLFRSLVGPIFIASRDEIAQHLRNAAAEVAGHKFSFGFLLSEWDQVVDAWQVETWEQYRDVRRLGRKTRLPESQRVTLWAIYDKLRVRLAAAKLTTFSGMFSRLARALEGGTKPPFEFAVVDEAQDIGVAHLRFFAAMGGDRPNSLFFAGDLGQRIFQQPFSWKALGVDIRGRSKTLHVNYRTSHQIRMQADRLLGPEVTDADGLTEERDKTISVFNGPAPNIRIFDRQDAEIEAVGLWLSGLTKEGLLPHEIGVFVRSGAEFDRAQKAVESAGLPFSFLDENVETMSGQVAVCTMHVAKGLEFRAVAVMACDDEVIPSQQRIGEVTDDGDLEEVYNTERHLLYVACTRARDQLLITATAPASEFLDDLKPAPKTK